MTRHSTEIGAAVRAQDVEPAIVRGGAAGAIALNAALPLIELWRIAAGVGTPIIRDAVFATIVTMALHLRHVAFGLRNERPASNLWTLTGLAIVNLAAVALVGRIWEMQLASLAVSILIVVRGPSALVLVGAVVLAPLILAWTPLGVAQIAVVDNVASHIATLPAAHVAAYLAWRTVTLYIPVRLVAITRQLDAARRSLESRAVIQARTRIEGDLRNGLELALTANHLGRRGGIRCRGAR
jgi:hypothetical protein